MPKPSKQDRQVHRSFLRRQKVYETKYIRVFLAILSRQYREAAKLYPAPYIVNPNDYKAAIVNVYTTCIPIEAEIAWNYYVAPLTSDQKDFFDDLVALLGFDIPKGEHIRLWRSVTRQWLDVNILSKIQGIAATTQRAIAKVIQQGIDEGLSEREIGKLIQANANGEVNQYRSVLIARTESIMAMNKGRRLAMFTSNLEWNKRWLDTPDERTRTSHRIVASENPRPLDEVYHVPIIPGGGTEPADTPGDPRLSAGNICNCRCCETFEVRRDGAGRPIRRDITPKPIKLENLVGVI